MTEKEDDKTGAWDGLLVEKDDLEQEIDPSKFIKPNIEHRLPANKRKECRDILLEIKSFGVSQRQMLYLIYIMALELDDQATMRALVGVIGEHRENTPLSPRDSHTAPKIILTD